MGRFPWPQKYTPTSFTPLEDNSGFLLEVEGHKVVALRLPSTVTNELSGKEIEGPGRVLSKLKVKLGIATETEQWLTVTSVKNPLLEESDRFGVLVAQGLTDATGVPVKKSSLVISASFAIVENDQRFDIFNEPFSPQPLSDEYKQTGELLNS